MRRMISPLLRRAALVALFALVCLGLMAASVRPAAAQGTVTATTNVPLRMRVGPGTQHAIIGSIPSQTTVEVHRRSPAGDWVLVTYRGVSGWSASWYMTFNGNVNSLPVGDSPAPAAPAAGGVTATTNVPLRMRSGPGTNYGVLATLAARTTVPVVGRNDAASWLMVDFGGQRGWIAAWYATMSGSLAGVPVAGAAPPAPAPVQAQAPAPAPAPQPGGPAGDLIRLVNQVRCQNGAAPVVANAQIMAAAQVHANDMASNNFFGHTGSDGSRVAQRLAAQGYNTGNHGETLGAGPGDPGGVLNMWLGSGPHRDILLNPGYNEVGAALVSRGGTAYGNYWVLDFGARPGVATPRCSDLGF